MTMIPQYYIYPTIENNDDKYFSNTKILDCITNICDILIEGCDERLKISEEL